MRSAFAFRPLPARASLVILAGMFVVCWWLADREKIPDLVRVLAMVGVIVSLGVLVPLATALALERFPVLFRLGMRRVEASLTVSVLLGLMLVFWGLWQIEREAVHGPIYFSIVAVALVSLLGAVAFKGFQRASRADATRRGMMNYVGCGLMAIPATLLPPGALLLPLGFLGVVYGLCGYFALSMNPGFNRAPAGGAPRWGSDRASEDFCSPGGAPREP